jgi:phage-related protein (TIGR01555 family)
MAQRTLAKEAKNLVRGNDSFQNFVARVGLGTANQSSASTYGFNPISRNRVLLEWMYRGSWICGITVDSVADDMTRAGIEITGDLDPTSIDNTHAAMARLGIWKSVNATAKWGRLYGGAIAVMLIDGQKPETPLRWETVGKGAFKGLCVLDRWMVQPSLSNLVKELGPDLGQPMFYQTVGALPGLPQMKVHYSRVLRIDGVDLPYWQKISENMWGMSVIERLYDRLVAFDSTTQGIAQLVYKAHLRTLKVEGLRKVIAEGGPALASVLANIDMIRALQTNEGMSVIDAKDELEVQQYAFAGLDDVLLQFGQQLSGATQIPLVRLFGQSPAGLSATGESDLRNYYDGVNQQQELRLRRPFDTITRVTMMSEGMKVPDGLGIRFNPLWQLDAVQKSEVAVKVSTAVSQQLADATISPKTALKELRQSSRETGIFTNISDEEIEAASDDVPVPGETEGGEEDAAGVEGASAEQSAKKPSAEPKVAA